MTTNLAKWASNNGQIIKSGLPNGRRAKFVPSVAGIAYDTNAIWAMSIEHSEHRLILFAASMYCATIAADAADLEGVAG